MRPADRVFVLALASTCGIPLATACGGASDVQPSERLVPPPDEVFDPCKDSAPLGKTYRGLLKDARCDQDVYFRMAKIAGQLGVDCTYCHAPKVGTDGGAGTDYPKMTEMKQRALFMGHAFLDGLVRKDKKESQCSDCHVDKNGKAAPKFLGTPRDKAFTLEWMNIRMVNDFVTKDGAKLKCKHCHVAGYGMPGFEPRVILGEKNPNIPGVPPFVPFAEEREPAPATTSVPSAASNEAPSAPPSASASSGAPAPSATPNVAPSAPQPKRP